MGRRPTAPIKIIGGTPQHGGSALCESCRFAAVVRGTAIKEEIVHCRALDERIRFKVMECSSYDDRSKPTLQAMKQISWDLATDKSGHKIGFLSPQEWRDRVRRKELDEEAVPLVLPDGTTDW